MRTYLILSTDIWKLKKENTHYVFLYMQSNGVHKSRAKHCESVGQVSGSKKENHSSGGYLIYDIMHQLRYRPMHLTLAEA